MDQRGASRQPGLGFDGDERKYEFWETKMLGHLFMLGLEDTVEREPATETERAAAVKLRYLSCSFFIMASLI